MPFGSQESGPGPVEEELLSILLFNRVEHATGHYDDKFWPRSVLAACLTRPRVQRALVLEGYPERVATDLAGNICHDGSGGKRSYLRLFAILVLCEKVRESESFLDTRDGFCDDSLPLRPVEVGPGLSLKLVRREDQDQAPTPACLQRWRRLELESFLKMQRHVSPHIFRRDPKTVARHETLDSNQILPWVKLVPGDEIGQDTKEPGQGAYSTVYYHKVHPGCHEFSFLLRELNLHDTYLAVKTLRDDTIQAREKFQHEADQLRRFNGKAHPQLVTLLATYQQGDSHYFVFPYAEDDLLGLWEQDLAPRCDSVPTVQWTASQLQGLMGALAMIHEPVHLPEEKFGRHGDIKPENILCYRMRNGGNWLLVLTDLGLSAYNSKRSRSNIPGDKISAAPGYRPPECDVKDGLVSRLFDVWTMGCLILDAITYALGGQALRDEFERKRMTPSITGGMLDSFYNTYLHPDGKASQSVKPEVTKWIDALRRHEHNTRFTKDLLDLVENEMLIVLGAGRSRSSSEVLARKLYQIRQKCFGSGCEVYCMQPFRARLPLRQNGPAYVVVNLTEEVLSLARTIRNG